MILWLFFGGKVIIFSNYLNEQCNVKTGPSCMSLVQCVGDSI